MPPRIEQTDDGSVYVLDVQAVREVLRYTHWIPWKKGFRAEFMRKHYPGWSLHDLIEALKEAGALVKARGSPHHFSGYQTREILTEVRIPIREDISGFGGTPPGARDHRQLSRSAGPLNGGLVASDRGRCAAPRSRSLSPYIPQPK